jgi:hypothetical protein
LTTRVEFFSCQAPPNCSANHFKEICIYELQYIVHMILLPIQYVYISTYSILDTQTCKFLFRRKFGNCSEPSQSDENFTLHTERSCVSRILRTDIYESGQCFEVTIHNAHHDNASSIKGLFRPELILI